MFATAVSVAIASNVVTMAIYDYAAAVEEEESTWNIMLDMVEMVFMATFSLELFVRMKVHKRRSHGSPGARGQRRPGSRLRPRRGGALLPARIAGAGGARSGGSGGATCRARKAA